MDPGAGGLDELLKPALRGVEMASKRYRGICDMLHDPCETEPRRRTSQVIEFGARATVRAMPHKRPRVTR